MDKQQWLETATFYQIYPQSFNDSNGDGIGDLEGIRAKIPYLKKLGVNGLWLNPIFDSPFRDAGYDVRDYYTVASRYGTNDDLEALVSACHEAGIKVLLDLVPGHTSDEHPWFVQSRQPEDNEFSSRYIWTDSWFGNADGLPFVAGVAPRNGCYVLNFFHSQPALNYGFGQCTQAWQQSADAPGPAATRAEMAAIIRFWLGKGVDGFRVDMADSLVKHDEDNRKTIEAWQEIYSRVRPDYPDAIFVSEWGRPVESLEAGFDMDFYLDWFENGYNKLVRTQQPFFRVGSPTGVKEFTEQYLPNYAPTLSHPGHHFSLISGNHDCTRLAHHLDPQERRLFFLFLLTMPGVPFIYYGDEIAMTWHDLPTHEGGYSRTGSRTPMQWTPGPQAGFSTNRETYLPAFTDTSVEQQETDPDSLWNFVRTLIALRAQEPDLHASAPLEFIDGEPRVMRYRRGQLEVILNVDTCAHTFPTNAGAYTGAGAVVLSTGPVTQGEGEVTLGSGGGVVLRHA